MNELGKSRQTLLASTQFLAAESAANCKSASWTARHHQTESKPQENEALPINLDKSWMEPRVEINAP